jgi:uncharacterized membrane protein YphA (DoxX/SURF4 family)
MAYGSRAAAMEHPAQWLAILRMIVGLYFAKALLTKVTIVLVGGWMPVPETSTRWLAIMPELVAKQAGGNPVLWYRDFLLHTVLPHARLFAHLTAWGEVVAGVLLTLGLLTGAGALIGLVLVASYGLATQWMSPNQQGFHLVLFALMLAFVFARAGRTWGLDGVLARARPRSLLTRRPFA